MTKLKIYSVKFSSFTYFLIDKGHKHEKNASKNFFESIKLTNFVCEHVFCFSRVFIVKLLLMNKIYN